MSPAWFDLVLAVLAVARMTQLVTHDLIGERARTHLETMVPPHWLRELVSCPHCIGFWITLPVVAVWWADVTVFRWVAAPWAVAFVAGHLVERAHR